MHFAVRHVVLALILHSLVLGLLLMRFGFSDRKIITPPIVNAVLIDSSRSQLANQRAAEAERERQKQAQIAREKAEQEAQQRAEAEKQRQQKLAKEKAEQEARQKAEAAKKKAAEEAKKKAAEEARKKAEAEKQRKAAEAKKKAEAEQQRRLEQERKAREARQKELSDALAAEEGARKNAEIEAQKASKRQIWVKRMEDRVRSNWLRPPGFDQDFVCLVEVQQLPGGQITSVKVIESCGNRSLDDSVEKAVRKSDPLPVVPDPSIFDRELRFYFKPEA